MMQKDLPAITGLQLIKLLEQDRWENKRHANHGKSLVKYFPQSKRIKVAVIPNTSQSLPTNTLGGILGVKQTGIGRKGLLKLIEKYSLK